MDEQLDRLLDAQLSSSFLKSSDQRSLVMVPCSSEIVGDSCGAFHSPQVRSSNRQPYQQRDQADGPADGNGSLPSPQRA